MLFCVLFVCKCVLFYCHQVSTQLQLTDISYHIINRSDSENEPKCKNVKWFSFSDEIVTARFVWRIMSKRKSYCGYCIASIYCIGTVRLCFSAYNVILHAWMNSVWIKLMPGHIRKRRSCCGWFDKDTQGSRVMAPCILKHDSSFMWMVSLFVPGEKDWYPFSRRLSVRHCHSAYEVCSKSIVPLVGKNTVIHLDVWNPNPLQSSLLGNAHTSSSGPAITGNISGKHLVESCSAGLLRSA